MTWQAGREKMTDSMRTNHSESGAAFTRVELLAVSASLVLLATLWAGAQADQQGQNNRIRCVSQLKQIGLAFRMFSNDHNDQFPMRLEAAKGGSKEAIERAETFRHFQAIAQELVRAKLLACPADQREPAAEFAGLKNENISYFVGLDADEARPQMLLTGDRNITNGVTPEKAILELSAKPAAGWTETLHGERGNLGLSDGSVQQMTTVMLRRQIDFANAAQPVRDGKTRIQLPEAGSGSSE